ncbi:hypothetical protein ACFXHK_42415 [Embleya sp. NPDC059267]|uniref:hypothetical protein n=1 Tax=unclassified Embleya TaxID=2699296 RepID=UPI0036CDF3BE
MTTHASAVPATPLFVIEYPQDGTATVDGTPVHVPEGTQARHAAIDEVRFTASLLDRPVRAIDIDPDGTHYPLLVDPDGTLTFLAEPHPDPEPDDEAPDDQAHAPTFGEDAAATDDDEFDGQRADPDGHLTHEHDPYETPDPPETAPPPTGRPPSTTPARPGRARRRATRSLPRVTPAAIGLAIAAAVTVAAVLAWPDDEPADPGPGTTSRAETAAFTSPAGWQRTSAWTRSIAPPGAGRPSVAALGNVLAVLTPDRRVALLDPRDGRIEEAGEPLPAGHLALHATGDPTAPVLVAETRDGLVVWPTHGGPRPWSPPDTVALAPGARVSYAGALPLVTGPDGSAAALRGGVLVPVRVPPGTVAMAADATHVLAGRAVGPWELLGFDGTTRGVAPVPPHPGARMLRVAGGGHGSVAVVWSGPRDDTETLAVHDSSSGRVLAHADAPAGSLSNTWIRSDDGPLAALGPVVVDLAEGRASVTPGAVARSVAGDRVYGTREGHPVALTVRGALTMPDHTAVPWAVNTGRALLLTGNEDRTVLHAVEPAP